MNYNDWEYHESKLPADLEEKEKWMEALKKQFIQKIQDSAAAQEWLQQYNETTINSFVDYYADYKQRIVRYSSQYIDRAERIPELAYRDKTEQVLKMILQKKLFNLQCRWRAEQVTFPQVRVAYDFWYWEHNLKNCPFIDLVTQQEVEVMQRFVQSDYFKVDDWALRWVSWQDYEELTEKNEDGLDDKMPEWYQYYDTYMGTGHLLLLPDVRGPKEEYYLDIARKRAREETVKDETAKPYVPPVVKDRLTYSYEQFYGLACMCEDAYFKTLIQADKEEKEQAAQLDEEEGDPADMVRLLKNIPDLPPVRGGLSWRQALQCCYDDYIKGIIARDLSVVCEEYNLYRSMGFSHEMDSHTAKTVEENGISKQAIERILQVRASLGEPADLNF